MEASIGGDVGEGSGESVLDCLWGGAAVGCETLDALTWTEEGWSEDTCFSRDRILRPILSLMVELGPEFLRGKH